MSFGCRLQIFSAFGQNKPQDHVEQFQCLGDFRVEFRTFLGVIQPVDFLRD